MWVPQVCPAPASTPDPTLVSDLASALAPDHSAVKALENTGHGCHFVHIQTNCHIQKNCPKWSFFVPIQTSGPIFYIF